MKKTDLTRRDFLRLAGLLPLSLVAPRSVAAWRLGPQPRNVIIIVFDALSAHHLSLHGYPRETMPNLSRWLDRAVVYHNHYAGGNFTTPGTASLLTGVLPWSHRALDLGDRVEPAFTDRNIFAAFQDYYRIAYTHNPYVDALLAQFDRQQQEHVPLETLLLTRDGSAPALFDADRDIADVSWDRAMNSVEDEYAYSLFFSRLLGAYQKKVVAGLQPQFPRGVPHIGAGNYFLLEDALDWLADTLDRLPQPFMGYFHFIPPHHPYRTHRDFYRSFSGDGFSPTHKPLDPFAFQKYSSASLRRHRVNYDEYLLYVDREFDRLMSRLQGASRLEDTWVVLTSDHGEMFERGILGHITPVLYQPLLRVPLIVFEPGRKVRADVFSNTSAIDLLPTLLHVTGQPAAGWSQGQVLPPFVPAEPDPARSLFVVDAKTSPPGAPISKASLAVIKGQAKLVYFLGFDAPGTGGAERIQLFDLRDDPEELDDLSASKPGLAGDLLAELRQTLTEANRPYQEQGASADYLL